MSKALQWNSTLHGRILLRCWLLPCSCALCLLCGVLLRMTVVVGFLSTSGINLLETKNHSPCCSLTCLYTLHLILETPSEKDQMTERDTAFPQIHTACQPQRTDPPSKEPSTPTPTPTCPV
ncbi:hypothetical protein ILYODFUR_029982 [Ilyodon furcidens]|uniref:Uncharacterized protein n=1 Tax=Ilyodon furcidens TaxID=33524 RepID=A0ABV0V779_9TELE